MHDEQRLVRRILDGDDEAFGLLLEEHQDRVYSLACRMVGRQDADDVTQETFIAVYRSLSSFRGRARLSTWIYRVAVNTCLMWNRRARPEEVSTAVEMEPVDPRQNVEAMALHRIEFERVEQALAKLDDHHRMTVVLHELHGLTYKEVAEVMEVPVGTVKSRLHHAFQHLRRLLTDVAAEAT